MKLIVQCVIVIVYCGILIFQRGKLIFRREIPVFQREKVVFQRGIPVLQRGKVIVKYWNICYLFVYYLIRNGTYSIFKCIIYEKVNKRAGRSHPLEANWQEFLGKKLPDEDGSGWHYSSWAPRMESKAASAHRTHPPHAKKDQAGLHMQYRPRRKRLDYRKNQITGVGKGWIVSYLLRNFIYFKVIKAKSFII